MTKALQSTIQKALYLPLRINLKEKANFFRILTTLIHSGIPLLKSLQLASKKVTNESLKNIIDVLHHHVEMGDSLSKGMKNYPSLFSESEVGLIEAGERTGTIDQSLKRITEDIEKYIELRNKVLSTLLYPIIILLLLLVVLVIIALFVIPTLVQIFETQNTDVPLALSIMKGIADFTITYSIALIAGVIGIVILLKNHFKKRKPKMKLHAFLLQLPIYGGVIRKSNLIMVAKTFSTLLEAEIPITKALDLLTRSQKLLPYQAAFEHMKNSVHSGMSLSESIPDETLLFPYDFKEMVNIGESTATLQDMLRKVAAQYTVDLDFELKNLTTIIEPLALIFVALFIGLFSFSVLGSIFDLITAITT